MKKNESQAIEFVATTIMVFQAIFNAYVLQGYFDQYFIYLSSIVVVFFLVLLFKDRPSFPVEIVGITLLLIYVFLRYLYSLGIQLPSKGRDVFLLPEYTLAFGYVSVTGAVACLLIYIYRFCRKKT